MASREPETSAESILVRQKWAREDLADAFKTHLGFNNVGRPDSEGLTITPFAIITDLRNANPDVEYTRDQALTDLFESRQVPFTLAVRIGVLWGASYGQSTFGETVARVIDGYNLADRERRMAEAMILGAARGLVTALATENAQQSQHQRNLQELEANLRSKPLGKLTSLERFQLKVLPLIHEYITTPEHTPEFMTRTWQGWYRAEEEYLEGESFTVTPCDRTLEEIREIEKAGRLLIYIPQELAARGRVPQQTSVEEKRTRSKRRKVDDKSYVDEIIQYGWLDIDASVSAPYTNTTEEELAAIFKAQNRVSVTAISYCMGSAFNSWITGEPFDNGQTQTRLLHTKKNGQVLTVSAKSNDNYDCYEYSPEKRAQNLGGRSVGIKPQARVETSQST